MLKGESEKMLTKRDIKILNLLVIFGIFLTYFFIPIKVLADYDKGEIKDSVISIGDNSNDGDILVTKTVEKTDNTGEYKVTFDVIGKDIKQEIESKKNSYTVFVLDASFSMMGIKWNKAREAAINFSKALVNDSEKNYLALVTFNGNGYQLRDFQNEVFNNNSFGSIDFYTNYYEGLSKAYNYFSNINDDSIKNIVFISDGEPNSDNYKDVLNLIKEDNINIYSLAYELDRNSLAYDKLLNISTNNKVYEVNSDDIDEKLLTIANEIIKVNAGTNGIITDNIGNNFNYVSGDVIINGKKVTINVGDITEDNKRYSFNIKIDDNLDNGWYPTNNGYTLEYIDSNNQKQILSTDKSASVYWVSDKVNLTINYYDDDNLFKRIDKKVKKGSIINDEVLDIDANINEGYYLDNVSKNDFYIDEDTEVNIYYKRINDLKYIVNYYKDNSFFDSKEYLNIEYGMLPSYDEIEIPGYSVCAVDNNTNPIIDNDTVLNVYYCKNNYKYKIRYYYDNLFDSEDEFVAHYNDIIDSYNDKAKEGYVIDKIDNIPLNILDDVSSNIINVYYKLRDIKYNVNYLDEDGNKIKESKEAIGKYHDVIKEVFEEIKNYEIISDKEVNMKLDDNTKDIDFIYKLKQGNVIIQYLDENGNKISNDTIISGYYGDNYSSSIKDIDNYQYTKDNKYLEGVIEDNNKIISLEYKKITLKDVYAPLTGISNRFGYIFILSLTGLLSLIIIKRYYKIKK